MRGLTRHPAGAVNDEDLDSDPVILAIRARMERMLADTSFKPGPPKKKAHKVMALAPTIRALRAQGRTWPACAEACKAEGLIVTPKTVREVMRDLDGPSSDRETIRVELTKRSSETAKAATPRRKSQTTTKRKSQKTTQGKSAGKLQRTPCKQLSAASAEVIAHVNGRVQETRGNLHEEDGAAPHRNDRAPSNGRAQVGSESPPPTPALASPVVSVDAPPPAAPTAATKRRFGAKGIER